nr:four-carbon acid sugar kinase family protein [Metasolibacillus fluoroglycofenilyticus]
MKIGVIADDLTGANATGVRLTKSGFQTSTMVHFNQMPPHTQRSVCVDTDSRYADSNVAKMRVSKVLENLSAWGVEVVCKRIDSTVRGNIGVEIDTVLDYLGETAIAVIAPSFPDSGRVVSGGYLLVNGIPLQATDVAKDPVAPLTQSYVPNIVEKQSKYKVTHLGLNIVLEGEKTLAQAFEQSIAVGNRVFVVDAVTNEDIEIIANAMAMLKSHQMIPCDPGPLTAAYSKAYFSNALSNKKFIVTVGSVTTNSANQLHYLLEKTDAQPIYVETVQLTGSVELWEQEVQKVVDMALKEMQQQEIIIITTYIPGSEPLNLKDIAQQQGMTQEFLAKRIADGLGKITRLVIEKSEFEIGGCFSSGGDVTASICSIGGAEGIKLNDEVLPLIAYGQFIGGHFDGIPLVTKGGMAGDKKAIYTSVRHLIAMSSN